MTSEQRTEQTAEPRVLQDDRVYYGPLGATPGHGDQKRLLDALSRERLTRGNAHLACAEIARLEQIRRNFEYLLRDMGLEHVIELAYLQGARP